SDGNLLEFQILPQASIAFACYRHVTLHLYTRSVFGKSCCAVAPYPKRLRKPAPRRLSQRGYTINTLKQRIARQAPTQYLPDARFCPPPALTGSVRRNGHSAKMEREARWTGLQLQPPNLIFNI